ncbi:lactose permease [Microdochium trichocladiopsis]|uniref:Lactose permease n=1 Tax=Microdochium trichocladiopsis TaxID=1682393 RepID=A0A9P8XX20_9PEZI|nr:lactose permease [Microdochium trichocladiopsis]KAH7021486.1 lactose permease [Microdochium trichocladiopsis]
MVAEQTKGHTADPIVTRLVEEDKTPWYKKPNLRVMYVWLFICCMGVEITSGFDSQLLNTLQYSDTFNKYFGEGYINPSTNKADIRPSLLGFMNACYQLGTILAVPIAPWLNNKYGRRWSIMAGSLIMMAGALLQGFAQHVAMYIIARMLLGVGILFAIIGGSALIGELAHPKERPTLTSFFNASYFLGAILAAGIALGTVEIIGDWAWRLPSLLQMAPSFLQVATVFLLPESPRWLVSKDRDEEALAVLVKYHAEGDANSLLVQAEMEQIRTTIKLEMESAKQTWWSVVSAPGMRRRSIVSIFLGLFTQLSGNSLLSYYSSLLFNMMNYTTPYAKTRINIANQCWSLLTAVVIAMYVTRFKRRLAFMTSATLMLCVFIGMTVSFYNLQVAKDNGTTNNSASIAALFFYFSYQPTYNIGNNALTYTYLLELWPYGQRTRGIGIQQIFGKAGLFFSQNVNPLALTSIGWKFMAIYCGWIAFEFIIVYFLYPETQGRTLEELAFLFEGDELNDKATAAVEKRIHGDAIQPTVSIEEEKRTNV